MKRVKDLYEQQDDQTNYQKYKMQFFATAIACLSGLTVGAVGGYTSPAMAGIQKQYSLNDQEVSWVTSISMFGSVFGCCVGGYVANCCGRKHALIISSAICVFGWLPIVCAKFVSMLYIGRFISGFAIAMSSTAAPMYVTEIASAEIRGVLSSCYILLAGIGVLYSYVIGTFISWRYLALACMVVPAVQILLLTLLPETPAWLIGQNYKDEVADSLKWLNRTDSLSELGYKHSTKRISEDVTLRSVWNPALMKPFAIVGLQLSILQCSGIGVIVVYAVSIFQSATDVIDPNLSAIIIGGSLVIAHLVTFSLVDKVGRRVLLLISSIFMSVGMIALGTYLYYRANDPNSVSSLTWLPITSLVLYVFAYGFGYGPIPWIMLGELFPNRVRGLTSSILTTYNYVLSLIMAKTYVDMLAAMGDYGVFWFYGAVCVFAVFFTYCFVPETKGMTILEIEERFTSDKTLEVSPLMKR